MSPASDNVDGHGISNTVHWECLPDKSHCEHLPDKGDMVLATEEHTWKTQHD